jgi:alkaline phosphatase D
MNKINRRQFIEAAGALGAAAVWCRPTARGSAPVDERRDLYPEGVASGDPDHSSVILWTRRPYGDGRQRARLRVQVATDKKFSHLIANTFVPIVAEADWTARVLVGGMEPSRAYWYRFVDEEGLASRVGRTMTAPRPDDGRPIRFAFVSCQNANQGAQNAWRRMIFDDEAAHPDDRIEFVLNLGDFIYEVVWYPEDRPQGYYARRLRPIVHYPSGRKFRDFHVPGSLDDYRAVYQAYLHDPDIQDARARWPLVSIWDNHEFSWLGWQSFQQFNGEDIPAQTLKVAANQAWFEYQPARVANPGSRSLERFERPSVSNTPIERFDDAGLGQEPNNLAAIHSLKGYRVLQWGKHLDLLVTDQRSYRSQDPIGQREARAVANQDVNLLLMHGVRSSLEYARSGDIDRARALSNADLSPHLAFLDLGGHGFSKVRLDAETLDVEFVGIPRPLERSDRADGGPVFYRVRHRAKRWGKGEAPRLEQLLVEGNPVLSLAGSASRSRSEG